MKTRVGVLGLGNIGGGMASRLIECGYEVIGYDVAASACEALQKKGGGVAKSPAELARSVNVVVSSLPNPKIVREAFLGKDGWLEGAIPTATMIESSTIDPHTIKEVAQEAQRRGIRVLDVALSGEPPQAAKGELVFMVGGRDEDVEDHRDVLETLAKKIHRTGGIGTAKTVKLVNNLMSLGNIAVASEAFVLGVKCGMDPEKLYEILSTSGGRSAHFVYDFPKVLEGNYQPGFKTHLAYKDISLILDLAREEQYETILAPVIASLYQKVMELGMGEEHFTSVVKLYEEKAGIRVSSN